MEHKHRYQVLFDKINQYNEAERGVTRIAYTNVEQTCIHAFMRMCKAEGLSIRLDQCGNVIARREGKVKGLPPVLMGSHLDTVYQGGKYDGVVGVMAALEVVRRLNEKAIDTDHPIEIIAFACEESARFGVSTLGSKAMTGLFDKDKLRYLKDRDGITLEDAFSLCALDIDSIDEASRAHEEIKAFIELHVEQGPILQNNEKQIGIVTGIAAPVRLLVNVLGKSSHSGTTPMDMRKDALLGASEIVLALEHLALAEKEYGTVATVGVLNIESSAMNVIPGSVELKVDIRSTSVESRQRVVEAFIQIIQITEQTRQLEIKWRELHSENPVLLSQEIGRVIEETCQKQGLSYQWMASGAGHDAMNLTRLCPTGLIFIPSVDGLSHHPDEFTELKDILSGIDVLESVVLYLAQDDTEAMY